MGKSLRVLVIEDSEFDALFVVNLLRRAGYEPTYTRVDTAEDMRRALASGPWDVILSDHQMPRFSAPEALQVLQETGRDLPFIIVSGGIGEETAVAAMKAGAHDYLMKGALGRLVPAVEREIREAANRQARRQAERSLRESEQRYRLLWENALDAVLLLDAEGTIQFANAAVSELFGYTPNEVVGQSFFLLLPKGNPVRPADGLACGWQLGPASSKRQMFETIGRHKSQREVILEAAFSEIQMEGKGLSVAFLRDITERKRAEQTLRENAEQFRVAREIQQRLFPKGAPALPGFDIAGASYPAAAAGGDYYDYLPIAEGGVGIVVGDVTGHGVGPALLMAETRAYLRAQALSCRSVGEILTQTNQALAEDIGEERYVTVLLARLDPARRTLAYVNAGHPSGYILNPQGDLKTELARTGPPLSPHSNKPFKESDPVVLEAGDLILLLTDGFEDAFAPGYAFFGAERALEVVRANRDRPASQVVDALYEAVSAFVQGAQPPDDLTAVVVKVLPG